MSAGDERPWPDADGRSLAFRTPHQAELLECADIWHESVSDYLARLATQAPPLVLDPFLTLLRHLLETDPERFMVAVEPAEGRVVGFASATQREHVWFLAMLYVRPEAQGHGVGRALLIRVFPGGGVAGAADADPAGDGSTVDGARNGPGVMATCTDSAQPVSNALYASYGIVPRVPMLDFVGRPTGPDAFPSLPAGVRAVSFTEEVGPPTAASAGGSSAGTGHAALAAAVDAIDRDLLGYAHPQDHGYLRRAERQGFLYRAADGTPLGYAYTSAVGRVGPVALLDETLMAPVLGHVLTAVEPPGASVCWVPGVADRAVVALLRAGFRLGSFPGLLCSTRPFATLDRYLPTSLAIL